MKSFFIALLQNILGRVGYEYICGFYKLGYWPHIKNPRSYNEHIMHRKLYNVPADAAIIADKYAVRDYISARVGDGYFTKVYWVGDDLSRLDWDALPKSFVAKATHGSGDSFMLLVDNKNSFDKKLFYRHCMRMLNSRFGKDSNETFYTSISPRIMIEERLTDRHFTVPPDFKFYIFHGKIAAVAKVCGRFSGQKYKSFYSSAWDLLPMEEHSIKKQPMTRPLLLAEMSALALKLAAGWDHLRVDMYCPDDQRIVVGELTMTNNAGHRRFIPKQVDFEWGDMWAGCVKLTP